MPLDPFFAERLRVHRRYLLGQAWTKLRSRLPGAASAGSSRSELRRSAPAAAPAAPRVGVSPEFRTTDAAAATDAPPAPKRDSPAAPLTPRQRHRRAALAWDRQEQRAVGLPGPALRTVEHEVPVDGFPSVRIRVYLPDERSGPSPACLVFGGGAFRIGGIDYPTADAACRRRAAASGVTMIAVDYALAPEHRHPTQIEQAYAAWEWVHAHAVDLGVDPQRIGVSGTSAGGNLAAVLTLMNRDRAQLPIRLQILEVPVTDLTWRWIDLRATWALGIPAVLALRELRSVARTYLHDPARARQSYVSPLRAPSLAHLPPAVIFTAEYDPLRRQGAAYAAALRRAGVSASAVRYLGVTHDTPVFVGALASARRWEDDVVTALRSL
ncbi:alpha/beta hydrolase [Microbacterium lushaniae]|nr:alpha/beta hydrolase [Microbacterium lushaniae]KAA9154646.1 alpha/beta hydrolase [Microbacterium lushaniae]